MLENLILSDYLDDNAVIFQNYFATADSGLAAVMKATTVNMLVIYNNKIISIRKPVIFNKDELGCLLLRR